ncbi:zinc finger CCCH domain-containing protein 14 [Galendromus occidentalis]|uniref:Zinc finger CCCH domain-containing protein 14 n=1 Tax=Galendromus occidentalis TaxID=34638 RepID=A0AAJ6QWX6_9ACAR|nr:zinc finger CCCH domain-containing protein 14 [Galendromus occidentalis]
MAAEPSGQDVSQRIRNAIRSKLVDIGCYVDDELPDYVMVMIANKKTKDQMKADLELFLGEYCTSFCDWLHQVLDHLQRYAREGKRRLELFDERSKNRTSVGDSEDEVDLHPNAEEARDFPDFESKDNSDSKKKIDSKKSRSPLRKIEEKTKKRLRDRVEEVAKEVKRKDESRGAAHKNESSRQKIEMADDRSRKGTSVDEKSPPKTERKKRASPESSRGTKTRGKDRKEDRSEKKGEKNHSDKKKHAAEEKETNRERQKNSERQHTDSDSRTRSSTSALRSSIKSAVSAKTQDSESDEYEEYDPSKPQLRSIAKIAPRKKLMARDSLEKNKLLAKAILDANNSIQQGLPAKKILRTEPPSSANSQPKRSIRDRLGAYVTDAIASRVAMAQRFHEMPPSLGDEDEDEENTLSNDRHAKPPTGHVEDLRLSLRKKEKRNFEEKHATSENKDFVQEATEHRKHTGLPEPERVPAKSAKEPSRSTNPDQTAPAKICEGNVPKQSIPAVKVEETPKNVIVRNGMIVKPSPLLEACGLSEIKKRKIEAPSPSSDDDSKLSESPQKRVKSAKADHIPLKSLDDLIKPGQADLAIRPPRRRCHFDPSCTNVSCPFAHPGQPCTSFPHCGLKASVCNFRHPPCYYDKSCSSRTCQFNHKHDGMPTPEDAKPAPCKYFPNCTNAACPFYHPPIPCKFGLRCQALTCPFVHPQKSTVAKLKWVAH